MERKNDKVKSLLNNIKLINNKYKKIAELTGENFNVFKILGLHTSEVRTHSSFISELLNPKGSHGKNDVFLKLFTEKLDLKNFDTTTAIVTPEKYIGKITVDKTKGGRIDIVIENNSRFILIENKIYAGDQVNQLLRYHNYNKKAHLFYLSLFGEGPDNESTGNKLIENEDYQIISYQDTILKWLQDCQKEATDQPIIRETIKQYLNLISHLTGKAMNNDMNDELTDLIKQEPENIDAAFAISYNLNNFKEKLIKRLLDQLKTEASENLDLSFDYEENIIDTKEARINYYNGSWKYFKISFAFASNNFNYFYYGIYINQNENKPDNEIIDSVRDKLPELTGGKNQWWACWKYFKDPDWETNPEPWKKILTGELAKEMTEIVRQIYNEIKDLKNL